MDSWLAAYRIKFGRTAHIWDGKNGGLCGERRMPHQALGNISTRGNIEDGLRSVATDRPRGQSDLSVCGRCVEVARARQDVAGSDS